MRTEHLRPPESLVILGTCGGAREAFHIVREYGGNTRVLFVNDVDPMVDVRICDEVIPVVNDWNFSLYRGNSDHFRYFTVGMGDPRSKHIMVAKALASGLLPAPALVSHDTVVRPGVKLSAGVVVHPQSYVGSNSEIGKFVVIHKAMISCNVVLGDYVTCAPHSSTGMGACLSEGVYLGARACVAPDLSVASWTRLGLSSFAGQSIADEAATYVGNPMRRLS
jgi:acetyltransferase-like isoleucine patch superfamily enzyme